MLGKTYCKGRAASAAPVSTEAAHQRPGGGDGASWGWRLAAAPLRPRCERHPLPRPRRAKAPGAAHFNAWAPAPLPRSRAAATIPWSLLGAGAGQPGHCGRRQRPGSQPPHLLRGHRACGGEGTATRKLQKRPSQPRGASSSPRQRPMQRPGLATSNRAVKRGPKERIRGIWRCCCPSPASLLCPPWWGRRPPLCLALLGRAVAHWDAVLHEWHMNKLAIAAGSAGVQLPAAGTARRLSQAPRRTLRDCVRKQPSIWLWWCHD